MGLGPSPEDAVRKRRGRQEADDIAKIRKKYIEIVERRAVSKQKKK